MYTVIELMGTVGALFFCVGSIKLLSGLFEDDLEIGSAYIIVLIAVIVLSIIGIICFTATKDETIINYTTIIARETIDSVEIDQEQNKVMWYIGKRVRFEDIDKCRFIFVDSDIYDDDVQNELDKSSLYYEWHREVQARSLCLFEKTYHHASDIKDYYVFYVPKEYIDELPESVVDWDRMFELR